MWGSCGQMRHALFYMCTYLGGGASSPVRFAKLSSSGGEVGGEGGKGGEGSTSSGPRGGASGW